MKELRSDHVFDPNTLECVPVEGATPFGRCFNPACGAPLGLRDSGTFCPKGCWNSGLWPKGWTDEGSPGRPHPPSRNGGCA